MAIELTEAAVTELQRILREHDLTGDQLCLRVGVRGAGHARSYTLDLAQRPEPDDVLSESRGFRIACTKADAAALDGIILDFRDTGSARGFTFIPPARPDTAAPVTGDHTQPPPTEPLIQAALREVIDPEVGLNVWDLGLVYGVAIEGRNVRVTMTMTTPACPLSEHIKREAHASIARLCPGVDAIHVDIVWDPPWNSNMIAPGARQTLGW